MPRIKKTDLPDGRVVSTAYLPPEMIALDEMLDGFANLIGAETPQSNQDPTKPFEVMLFTSEIEKTCLACERYATSEEALSAHDAMAARYANGLQ